MGAKSVGVLAYLALSYPANWLLIHFVSMPLAPREDPRTWDFLMTFSPLMLPVGIFVDTVGLLSKALGG